MKLKIPFRIAEAFLFTRLLLDLHQLHDVLLGHLGGGELGNIAFNKLTRLQQFKGAVAGELQRFINHLLILRMVGDDVDARAFTHFHIAFHFQHDNGFANHGAADALFIGDKPLCRQLIAHKVNTLLNTRLQLGSKLLIQTTRFCDFHIRSRKMATILDLLYHFYAHLTTVRHEKAAFNEAAL